MNLRAIRLLLIALVIAEAALWFLGPQVKDHMPDVAAGHRPDWWDDAALGIHFAAGINAVLCLVLLGAAQWWSGSISDSSASVTAASYPKYFWPSLIVAALACLALRLPLASKSLWWDEAWVIEQVSFGKWKPDSKQPDKFKFQAHDWARCAWYYQKPTNHAPMSLLQKASITAWQKVTHAPRSEFSDLSARIPALIASCVAVILLGLLLKQWGSPGAGVAAAFVLAIHPWHIRYGVDARAYALVVPLCIGGMLAITRILQTRGAKVLPWLGWGITEFLWLWAYPNALLDVAALNLVAAFCLWQHHAGKERWATLFRLAATNVFAAICLIQVFLPNLMQARHWAGQELDKHILNADLAASTLSQLIFGREYWISAKWEPIPQLIHQMNTFWSPTVFVSSVLLGMAIAHFVVLRSRNRTRAGILTLMALLISGLGFALTTRFLNSYFYPRFAIALLPVTIAAVCLAISMASWRWPLSILVGAPFLALSIAPIHFYLTRPYEPLHEVASFVENDSKSSSRPPLVACYGLGREVMPVYYPACIPIENAAGISRVLRQAHDENRVLYILYGYRYFNWSLLSDGFQLLDNRNLFAELKVFPGIETEFDFHVLKVIPGAVAPAESQ